jgi:hypothetical protein
MRLAEDGNNLRYLETEHPVLVGERGSMSLRLVLLPVGRVRPNLDALPGKRSPVARAADGARHPEATLADPLHDRRRWNLPLISGIILALPRLAIDGRESDASGGIVLLSPLSPGSEEAHRSPHPQGGAGGLQAFSPWLCRRMAVG